MNCPRCEVSLQPGLPHTQICPQCEGTWVENGSLSELLSQGRESLQKSALAPSLVRDHSAEVEPLVDCPACRQRMKRYVYCGDSGIVLDRCPLHGIWFDDGELDDALRYLELGGS